MFGEWSEGGVAKVEPKPTVWRSEGEDWSMVVTDPMTTGGP